MRIQRPASRMEFNKGINTITYRTWSHGATAFHVSFFLSPPFAICDRALFHSAHNFYRSSPGEASRRERLRTPSKVVKMQMHRLRERLPAVSKPSGNLPDESTSPLNALKATSYGNRESSASIRKYVLREAKGQVFRFGRVRYLAPCILGIFLACTP